MSSGTEVQTHMEDEEATATTLSAGGVMPENSIILSAEVTNCSKVACSIMGANIE